MTTIKSLTETQISQLRAGQGHQCGGGAVVTRDELVDASLAGQSHLNADVNCECGQWSGVCCGWAGPVSETVTVEYMPECWRDDHRRAGYDGIRGAGRYPHNGAVRVRVSQRCGDLMIDADDDWARVVS